jgi:predicted DsbA family dithiol-disulfide isomerase
VKVDIYSDIACPWCYIGKARFERALAAFPGADEVTVTFRPFQLDPTTPDASVPLYEYTDRKFGPGFRDKHAQVSQIAKGEGLEFRMDKTRAVNTFTAHRLLWLAGQEYGRDVQTTLKNTLLAGYFTEGADVGRPEDLVALAQRAGLDQARVAEFLAGDDGTAEVREELEHARALGVSAVPTFVFEDKYAVQGAQEASVFLQVLERVAQETAPSPVPGGGGDCADGACAV